MQLFDKCAFAVDSACVEKYSTCDLQRRTLVLITFSDM